ncbi:MAG TPA: hypothetical protein VGQ73_02785 [Gemmatimonadales bacterium]|jgi:hypothetical protein|nr:hypothetical protein [Gemmatimonadales bacterium]
MRLIVVRSALLLLLGALGWAGCGDQLSLFPATFENRVDSAVSMWAATRTPVVLPSGYLVSQRVAVRLDQVPSFDFLYDVTPAGEHIFVPLGALVNTGRTSGNPGFREEPTIPFDSITVAPQQNYVSADTIRFRLGEVYYLRSAVDPSCALGIPYYAKLQILSVDDSAFKVTFRILANINCGYRSLQPGLPTK